jgi:hypothetical protein
MMLMTRPEGKKKQGGRILSEKSRLMQDCDAIVRALRHISDATGSKAALNLTFADLKISKHCHTWKVDTDPWNSDRFPISIDYNGVIEPRKGSKRASKTA